MNSSVTVGSDIYSIKDCGGSGACLFKCLSAAVSGADHRITRRQIVNYVIDNWKNFEKWIEYVFRIKTKEEYRRLMSSTTTYGSEVECKAASELYSINVIIIRKMHDGYYSQKYEVPDSNGRMVYLLFTGMNKQNDLDGHYQVLEKCSKAAADSDSVNQLKISSSRKFEDITNKMCEINKSNKNIMVCNSSNISATDTKRRAFPKFFKETILHARSFFEAWKENSRERVIEMTAKCLNISERSVVRVCNEHRENSSYLQDPRYENCGRKQICVIDSFNQGIIRNTILNMYMEKIFPTVQKLHKKLINEVEGFPKISRSILYNEIKKLNFTYRKINKKPILMENVSIASKRAEYLRLVKDYRRKEWQIFYTDETWCGANHSKQYGWVEKIDEERSPDNYDQYRSGVQCFGGYRGGFVTPSGSGKRVIILHIGSENGFLEGGLNCFIGKKGSSNYHDEMNAQHYEEWFRRILMKLPTKSVIVMDQAPYHTMIHSDFKNPTTRWRKEEIINWMQKRNIPLPEGVTSFENLTKIHLLFFCKSYYYEKTYLLEKITYELRGDEVKILWLPVAHCEFNPIELVWAYVKNQVAAKNNSFKIKDVHRLCVETMNNIPETLWKNCVRHVIEYEQKYRVNESRLVDSIDSLIINTAEDSDSEASEINFDDSNSEDEYD